MKALRAIVPAAIVAGFGLAALGTWVRLENAGQLMCTDWPLCGRALVPPLSGPLAVEWAHRALSLIEGGLILAIFKLAWPRRGTVAGLQIALGALGFLFATEVALGAAMVFSANSPLWVAAHWAVAMSFLATLIGLAIVVRVDVPKALGEPTWLKLALTAALAFAAMSVGSFVSASYAGLACSDFPGCDGTFAGHAPPQFAQMLHRLVAGSFVVVAVLSTIAARQHSSKAARKAASVGLLLAFGQACLGIATVRLGDPLVIREAHAAVAGLTFLVFTAAAVLAALQPKANPGLALGRVMPVPV